jgi:Peptidase A4 family
MEGSMMKRLLRVSAVTALAAAVLAAAGPAFAAGPISDRHKTGRGDSASTNWSGYAAYNATFSHAEGDWTVPAANCSAVRGQQATIAAAWVGIDGFLSNTVEQGGTDTDCIGKTPFYIAWYEFFPDRPVFLDQSTHPVEAGDHMHAEVSVSGTTATITLQNLSRSWTLTPPPSMSSSSFAFSSAEWILEAPSNKLTNFGTVNFTNAAATGGGTTNGAIDDFTNDRITMVTRNGRTTRATPSSLSGGGTAFSVTFNHQ